MSLNSSYLDAFYACAQLKSFTKAAARLHITQSALSQRIKNLEDELGTTLMIRERSGLRLTETGAEILRYCQTKEGLESEVTTRLRAPSQSAALGGAVRIGAFSSVARPIVLPALAVLLRAHPAVQLKLVVGELHELPPLLRSGAIDFLIAQEKLDHEGLVSHELGTEKNVLVRKRGSQTGDEPETYLDHDEDDTITARYLRKKSSAGLKRHYLGDNYGILDGARLGLGAAVVPLHIASQFKDLEIVQPERVLATPVILHYYEQPFYSKLHQAVITALTSECPKLLGGA